MSIFCFHRWSKWKITGEYEVFTKYRSMPEPVPTGRIIHQRRECQRCGKVEINQQETRM